MKNQQNYPWTKSDSIITEINKEEEDVEDDDREEVKPAGFYTRIYTHTYIY